MFNGYTHDDLANKYNLTEDQIKNIITKCRKVITEHLP
jgi:Mor family transcriptional regulator